MARYIELDALVAEIEKRRKDWWYGSSTEAKFKREECDDILSLIDTLEVKEVDLNNKGEWKNTGGFGSTWDPDSPDYYPD